MGSGWSRVSCLLPCDGLGNIPTVPARTSLAVMSGQLVPHQLRNQQIHSVSSPPFFRLHIRCIFNASDFLPIQADVFSPPSPAPVTQSGPLRLELRIAKGMVAPLSFLAATPPVLSQPQAHRSLSCR